MPRPRGPHSTDVSRALAVRVPVGLAEELFRVAGADSGPQLAEFLRNTLRGAAGHPLDFDAGYEEGKMQGWADANRQFRAALKGVRA